MIKNISKFFYAISLFILFTVVLIIFLVLDIENYLMSIIICAISSIFAFVIPIMLLISGIINKVSIDNDGIHVYKNKREIIFVLWSSITYIQVYRMKMSIIVIEYNQNGIDKTITLDYTKKIINSLRNSIPENIKIENDF